MGVFNGMFPVLPGKEEEARAFAAETEGSCNHWWHRNLADPAVEADILQDPEFYKTSMRTDRRMGRKR